MVQMWLYRVRQGYRWLSYTGLDRVIHVDGYTGKKMVTLYILWL